MLYPLQPLGVALNLLFIQEIFFKLITKPVPVRKSNEGKIIKINTKKALPITNDMFVIYKHIPSVYIGQYATELNVGYSTDKTTQLKRL